MYGSQPGCASSDPRPSPARRFFAVVYLRVCGELNKKHRCEKRPAVIAVGNRYREWGPSERFSVGRIPQMRLRNTPVMVNGSGENRVCLLLRRFGVEVSRLDGRVRRRRAFMIEWPTLGAPCKASRLTGLGSCRLGSCRLGSCRLGSCRLGSCRLGSCRLGSCRLGSCRLGSCRLG